MKNMSSYIEDVCARLETQIGATPTGDLRNLLTEVNILLQSSIKVKKDFINKIELPTLDRDTNLEDVVTFDQAQALKSLGFDLPCRDYYTDNKELETFLYYEGAGNGWDKNSTLEENDMYGGRNKACTATSVFTAIKWLQDSFGEDIPDHITFKENLSPLYGVIIKLLSRDLHA